MSIARNIGLNIKALRKAGYSYLQIQAEIKCSLATIAYHCGEGQKDKTLKRTLNRQNNKRKYIKEIKEAQGICLDCKIKHPFWRLEFDHIKGKKIESISRMTQLPKYKLEDIKKEIIKCEIICANCHKDRTYKRLLGNQLLK